ncbi:eCIS core domain-containing protein [Undibacterium hunanense]|uniref:eCIS core domain-containing protein n=1 Tax=Undibacterium hunanense TaxID=2762292 RepID=UPI001E4CAE82|nr:DUF4157 domain-containing protein [Undibacterium hunanense]
MSEQSYQSRKAVDQVRQGALAQRRGAPLTQQSIDEGASGFVDRRPQARQLKAYSHMMQNSPRAMQLKAVQAMMDKAMLQKAQDEESLQKKSTDRGTAQFAAQAAPQANHTGLPNQLKAGIESLSGMSMDHVKVNYNSGKPAQLNAHAYAQGSEIHVAPGQEQHVPHEAWHVVQQAQGRVRPTMQMKQGVAVNDDVGLEAEADVMGAKALSAGANLFAGQGGQHAGMHVDTVDATATAGASRQLVTVNAAQGSSAPVQMYGETLQRLALYFGVEANFASVAAALGMAPTTLYFALTAIATVAAIWSVSKIISYLMGASPLTTGKLNVVGENHDESNPQRLAETNYTKRILGEDAGYWGEEQFALSTDDDWGDDKYLRMADLVYRSKDFYERLSISALDFALMQNLTTTKKSEIVAKLIESMKAGENRFMNGMKAEISSINALFRKKKSPFAGKLNMREYILWAKLLSPLSSRHNTVLQGLEAHDAVSRYDDVVYNVMEIADDIGKFGKQSIRSPFLDEPDITQQRSENMHEAANAATGKGVWKVGETHVNDMEKIKGSKKYRLVHRDSFIKALK